MSAPSVEKIADAVLYEGYLLYPYRSSAVKNRQRWNFGVVYPRAYSEAGGGVEPCEMRTECMAEGGPETELEVRVRCLRLVERRVGYLRPSLAALADAGEPPLEASAAIEIDGRTYESWQEAAECQMDLPALRFGELSGRTERLPFAFPATRKREPVRDAAGMIAGLIVRTEEPLECAIEVGLERARPNLFRISVRIGNQTRWDAAGGARERVLGRSMLSAHTILRVREGEFVSLLEPPEEYREAAAGCRNTGTWPVLCGEAGERHTVLSSPIILYDYPQVAPESPGDLFDGAEIDEILSLRILTLTEEEKSAMRRSDERARQILERTESLPPEHFMKLHGALRSVEPEGREGR
jgi:hypothetical protein